jgi:predicted MFS family arabinose efflux permease
MKTLALLVGPTLLVFGFITTLLFIVISFNEKKIELLALAIGLAVTICGWIITRLAALSKKMTVFALLLELL